jgi:hypothetical protein
MDALIKLGSARDLERLLRGPELVAANALGVLGAVGRRDLLRSALNDPRERVADAARFGLGELKGD